MAKLTTEEVRLLLLKIESDAFRDIRSMMKESQDDKPNRRLIHVFDAIERVEKHAERLHKLWKEDNAP